MTDQTTQDGFPITVEFEDGTTKVIHNLREMPHGVPFRIPPETEWTVVESL
jgi:hypothetical protein